MVNCCALAPLEDAGPSGYVTLFPPCTCTCTCDFVGVYIPDHPVHMSRNFAMAWICASYVADGLSCIALESVLVPCRIRSSGVRVGVVMKLWRNSTMSETLISLVSAGITKWQ